MELMCPVMEAALSLVLSTGADLAALLCWVMGESCALMMLKMNCLEEATNATGGTAIERQGLEAPPLWS